MKPEEILAKHVEWESMTYYSKVQKSILAAMEEYAKAYAPVPGKEEAAWKLCDSVQALFDMKNKKGSVHAMKVGWNIVSGDLFDLKKLLAASPSTASNEDKIPVDFDPEKEVNSHTDGEYLEDYSDFKPSTSKNEPKAVQQAANEIYMRITSHAPYKEMNGIPREWFEKCIAEGLASFNSNKNER